MKPPTGGLFAGPPRALDSAEIDGLADRHASLFEDALWPADAVKRSLESPHCFALLARAEGDPAGLVLARAVADECEILWLVVAETKRRKGLARSLLRAALRQALARGARRAFLEVSQANRAALTLYRTEGFRPCGRRPDYYGPAGEDGAVDALVFEKALVSDRPRPAH